MNKVEEILKELNDIIWGSEEEEKKPTVKMGKIPYEGNSVGGKEQQTKIDNRDNLMKGMLKNRYEDLMNE